MMINKQDESKRLIAYTATLRKDSGITTKEVAEAVGVKSQQISRLESGTVSPTLSFFINYVNGIGCEVEIVRKDGKNDYRKLVEQLLEALDKNDKDTTARVIGDLRAKVYQDKADKVEAEDKACDLLLKMNISDIPVTIETKTSKTQAKRITAYSKKTKSGN